MLLKADPIRRRQTTFHFNEGDESFALVSKQDIQPVLERNHEMRRHFSSAMDPHGEWGSYVGSIPVVIWEELERQGIAQDDKALLKWLQQPENRDLKIHPGRFV
jgi:hypothetical protein